MLTLITVLTPDVNPEMGGVNTLGDEKSLQNGGFSSRGVNAVKAVSAKTQSFSYRSLTIGLFITGLTGLTGLTPSPTGLGLVHDVVRGESA